MRKLSDLWSRPTTNVEDGKPDHTVWCALVQYYSKNRSIGLQHRVTVTGDQEAETFNEFKNSFQSKVNEQLNCGDEFLVLEYSNGDISAMKRSELVTYEVKFWEESTKEE